MQDSRKTGLDKLYDALTAKGYAFGSREQYDKGMQDADYRRELYNFVSKDYNLGSFEEYEAKVAPKEEEKETGMADFWKAGGRKMSAMSLNDDAAIPLQARQDGHEDNPLPDKTGDVKDEAETGTPKMNPPSPLEPKQEKDVRSAGERFMQALDDKSKEWSRFHAEEGLKVPYKADERNTRPDAALAGQYRAMEADRGQVAGLYDEITEAMNRRGMELDRRAMDPKNGWMDRPRGAGGMVHTYNSSTFNGRRADEQWRTLAAARNAISDARKTIEEADRMINTKGASWWRDTFVAGAARGFGDKFFDLRTWDYGISELSDNLAVASALDDFDKGKPLSKEQEMLLDALSVKMATDAYFGSYLGRGYKAGAVTAESLPFMLEMMINPAAKIGSTVTSKLARYAIKRFGKAAARKLAQKAVRAGARVAGDAVGSAVMAGTTGAVGVTADALDRMTPNVEYAADEEGKVHFTGHDDDAESPFTAFAKAFGARTIENHSEMIGNYFAPIGNFAGKMAGKGLEKVGLGKVNRWFTDLNSTRFAQMLDDFQGKTRWDGVTGEFMEEVAGGIENALVVGDQTLDTDKDTGVFNRDNLIDTFLGVGLMGGIFSAMNTASYRTPKYRMRQQLDRADNLGGQAFGEKDWGLWKGMVERFAANAATGEESAAGEYGRLSDLLYGLAKDPDGRQICLDYLYGRMKLQGMEMAQARKREEANTPEENDLESSYENGRGLQGSEMHDAQARLEQSRRQLKEKLDMEDCGTEILDDGNWLFMDREQQDAAMEYLNAKATWEGMTDGVRDEMSGEVESALKEIEANVNRDDNALHPATTRYDHRKVYIVKGVIATDSNGNIDLDHSDKSIIVRDAVTGEIHFAALEDIHEFGQTQDPGERMEVVRNATREGIATRAARMIDGILPFEVNDEYELTNGKEGTVFKVRILPAEAKAGEQADPDMVTIGFVNGDGSVTAKQDVPKAVVQEMSEANTLRRLNEYEKQRKERQAAMRAEQDGTRREEGQTPAQDGDMSAPEGTPRRYEPDEELVLETPEGEVRAVVTGTSVDNEGHYQVETELPVNGKRVQMFTQAELDRMVKAEETPAQEENAGYSLSEETDENGHPFVVSSDGSTTFGQVREESGLPAAPIKLSEGYQDDNGKGYGLVHIEANHGKQIKNAGFASVEDFVSYVAKNYDEDNIRVGKRRENGSITYLLQVTDKHDNTLFVELSRDGSYWNVNSAGIFRKGYSNKKETVVKTEPQQPNNASSAGSSRSADESGGIAPTAPNGKPTVSTGKGSNNGSNVKASAENAGYSLTEAEAKEVLSKMEEAAEVAPEVELTPENWTSLFGEDGKVDTPVGTVKMGENQYFKLAQRGRDGKLGMVKPTLEHPDAIVEDERPAASGQSGRAFSYVFVKTFRRADGNRYYYFTSVTVSKDGKEVVVSNQEKTPNRISKLLQQGKIAWIDTAFSLHPKAQTEESVPLDDSNRPTSSDNQSALLGIGSSEHSTGKGSNNGSNVNGVEEKKQTALSSIPVDDKGEPLFEQAPAAATWAALVELNGGDKAEAKAVAEQMSRDAQKAYRRAAGREPSVKPGSSAIEVMKARSAHREELKALQQRMAYWGSVAGYEEEQKRLAEMQALQAKRDRMAELRRELEKKGRYSRENALLGDPVSFRDYAMRAISTGAIKFVWGDDAGTQTKGLASHLGLSRSSRERNKRIWLLSNENGMRPERAAETLMQGYAEAMGVSLEDIGMDYNEALDEVLDILSSYDKPRDMFEAAKALHKDLDYEEMLKAMNEDMEETEEGTGGLTDSQGNPINDDGTLKIESVESVDELTDEDFIAPTRNVRLPKLPQNVDAAIGADSKPVIIKKNIFERNAERHPDISASQSREILESALYNPDLYGQNQKARRPYNWVVINTKDENGKNRIVLLEVNRNKDNIEIVHWHYARNSSLEQIKKQAESEGGLILILPSDSSEEAGGLSSRTLNLQSKKQAEKNGGELVMLSPKDKVESLSTPPDNLLSDGKGKESNPSLQADGETSAEERSVSEDIKAASAAVDTNPTEAQKKSGNYRKGHVRVGAFDITIEQPEGSVRRGRDENGREWESKMHNTYGYFRGTEGVDGDHIDVFLSNDMDGWDGREVFVVDQYNPDGTFDEHKVMLGFNGAEDAKGDYLANYEKGWEKGRRIDVTAVPLADFEKWIAGSHRKTKPFSEYRIAQTKAGKSDEGKDNPVDRIADVGEKIAGARKDMLREFAKNLKDVTLESLITLPFAKAFKRPALGEAVEKGLLRERDARFAEAVMACYLSMSKPRLSSGREKSRSKKKLEEWARNAYTGVQILQVLFDADQAARDKLIEESLSIKPYKDEDIALKKQRLAQWNPGSKFDGTCYPLNPIAVYMAVYERLGYDNYGEFKLPVSGVESSFDFDSYQLTDNSGNRIYPTRMLQSFEDVVDEITYLSKVENADEDTDHPSEAFRARGIDPIWETAEWEVLTLKNARSRKPDHHSFKTKEEAEKFVEEYKAEVENDRMVSAPQEKKTFAGYDNYELVFKVGKKEIHTGLVYSGKEDALAAIDEEHEKLNGIVNGKLAEGRKDKGRKRAPKDYVHVQYYTEDGTNWKYAVVLDEEYAPKKTAFNTIPYALASGFSTLKEAEAYIAEHREEWDAKIDDINRRRKEFAYFSGRGGRVGEDYRKGEDVTAEQFREQFGFRGVQFGNWANQKDRQEALNNAFDSFMDLAKLLGMSPRAISLNGELGIAFGARGGGSAAAHYETDEVVINLTKTMGAGSLAHEWWHALDNYFARQGNVKLGMITENRSIAARDELREAYDKLVSDTENSDYHQRSKAKGASYWGTRREETARMFAMWVFDEMSKRGEHNGFLSDNDPTLEERYAKTNYDFYTLMLMLGQGKQPMTFEEYRKSPAALAGYVYPSRQEMEKFGEDLRNIFDTVQERVESETGNIILYHRGNVVSAMSSEERALRDAVIGRLRESGMEVITDVEEGQRVLDMADGEARYMSFGEPYDYGTYPLGRVEPNLSERNVEIVDADAAHGFKNYEEARTWAKQNVAKTYGNGETGGKGNVRISNSAIDKFMSQSAVDKSDSKDVHMSVLKVLPKVLNTSIDVETHPDFLKGEDGRRDAGNGINKDVLVHRCYGAVSIDGKLYSVKITLKEEVRNKNLPHNAHSYEATKIELLEGTLVKPEGDNPNTNNSISAAKLLKNVRMSYNPSEKVLDASIKRSVDIREHRVYHGTGADFTEFDHSHMGEGEGAQFYGWGTYVTEVEGIGRTYAEGASSNASRRINKNRDNATPLERAVNDIIYQEEYNINVSNFEQCKAVIIEHLEGVLSYYDYENVKGSKYRASLKEGLEGCEAELEVLRTLTEEQYKEERVKRGLMRHLYTVEIPEDTGENYLDWTNPLTDGQIDAVRKYLAENYRKQKLEDFDASIAEVRDAPNAGEVNAWTRWGVNVYKTLVSLLGTDKEASKALSGMGFTGIKYPAEHRSGGRKNGAKNYVIFNEKDLKITDHVRFFRTADGQAYGFTVGGKIYIDPKTANSETPVHEYAHLWAEALRNGNRKEWDNVVELMKGTGVWEEVKRRYPELETDDGIAEEVLAHYSGRRGAELLREEARKIAEGNAGIFDKATAISALQRVRKALAAFWKGVADFLHIHYTTPEEVADRVMKDLLDGVDPRSMTDGGKHLRPDTPINVITGSEEHGFESFAEARDWARKNIARTYDSNETGGKGEIRISNAAIDKYLSEGAVGKSESKDVHLSVLKVLPDVIRESVDAEQHPDYRKGTDGERSVKNGINPDVTIHRLYGAVRLGDKTYRVKVTLKENVRTRETAKAYSYEATKIELLAGQHGDVAMTSPRNSNNSISAAKLLEGVEKSYGGGKFFESHSNPRFQFMGEKGAENADRTEEVNTRLENLRVAREMESAGKDAKAVKMATGWERGADGKWRYEIADGKYHPKGDAEYNKLRNKQSWSKELDALSDRLFDGEQLSGSESKLFDELAEQDNKFKAEFLSQKKRHLADWVENKELFDAYPELKNVEMVFTDQLPKDEGGYYSEEENLLVVNTSSVMDIESVVAHEVQHAIQRIEGFARGGNEGMFRDEERIRELESIRDEIEREIEDGDTDREEELMEVETELFDLTEDTPNRKYRTLAGEVEARNVERRMGMSEEERRASIAAETEDVAREDQLFLYGDDVNESRTDNIEEVNRRFNEGIERWESGLMTSQEYVSAGYPTGELIPFMPKNEIIVRQKVLSKAKNKHGLSASDIKNLPKALSHPIFMFRGKENTLSILTELRTAKGQNVFVAVELGRQKQMGHNMMEINDITTIHGREAENIVNPIIENDSLVWVDKKKGLHWLSSAQSNAQAIAGKTLDSATKVVENFENPKTSERLHDEGDSDLFRTDSGTTVSERTGTESERMAARVRELAEKLHLDNVEIVTDASTLGGRQRTAKGFYNKESGKITVVVSNHADMADIERTVLHEAVAHHGLRELFGEHFDTFLDNVFSHAGAEVAGSINEIRKKLYRRYLEREMAKAEGVLGKSEAVANAKRTEEDFTREATEEYLASLAERTDFEKMDKGVWQRIKQYFMDMLHSLGLGNYGEKGLTDNELRYILWRSYANLKDGGAYQGIFNRAADVARQSSLKVGMYAESSAMAAETIEEANRRFNEQLSELTKENANSKILSLGNPSEALLMSGVSDKSLKLYGNKLNAKAAKHGFAFNDLRDLPKAVAYPIAVFRGSTKGSHAILTELKINGENVLVSLSVGEDNDVDFNIVRSVYGKGEKGIVYWINNGKLLYADKAKALDYLRISAPIAEALSGQELDSATKVVEEFENPKAEAENDSGGGLLYREPEEADYEKARARDAYERRMKSGLFQSREALQDSMLSLKEAMDAILGEKTNVEDIDGFENAYLGENRMSSQNRAEVDAASELLFKPLYREVVKIAPTEKAREELIDYMFAKHGLERNAVFAERDAKERYEKWKRKHPDTDMTWDMFIVHGRDYSGLTALTGEAQVHEAEAVARRMVEEYEKGHDTEQLWKRVNTANRAVLKKQYESGLMGREMYDRISGMFGHYIPLQGFDETTSPEEYAYLTAKGGMYGRPVRAGGRVSKADNPFANMEAMMEVAIMRGNRNALVKQRFLNFVLNHPSDLVSVSDVWLKYDDVTGEWVLSLPDNILSTDSAEEVERKMQEHHDRLEALAAEHPDRYKRGRDAVNIPYRVTGSREMQEHQVVVSRGGRTYVLTVNGNPRLAQALNGLTNPDNDVSGAMGRLLSLSGNLTRTLSAFYTTRNPDFILSNFLRDTLYSNTMVWVKESPNYALRYNNNWLRCNPKTMLGLYRKYRKNTLDPDNGMEGMFRSFMMNGGETGYVNIKEIERRKKDISRLLKNGVRQPGMAALGLFLLIKGFIRKRMFGN